MLIQVFLKKINKIFILVLSALFFISCDNNDNNKLDEQLVDGKWGLTKVINTSIGCFMPPEVNDTHYCQINNNGTFERGLVKNDTFDKLVRTYLITDEDFNYGNEDNSIQRFIELSCSSKAIFFTCGIIDKNKQLLILTSDNKLL